MVGIGDEPLLLGVDLGKGLHHHPRKESHQQKHSRQSDQTEKQTGSKEIPEGP